ncbi:MAG: type II toxin-antitoxin system VapC family toxin [Caldilineaceae bacterium]|nr:type II toxin-antitoxin system VapC family toxin [Caldilineaceae bacterium]
MNVVDSSGWLEYFANGVNAAFFAPAIEEIDKLIVPTIILYEVFKRIYQQRSEEDALQAVAHMQQGTVIDVDSTLALEAARISADEKIPMADSLILATAQRHQATLWTQDVDLQNFPNVRYVAK